MAPNSQLTQRQPQLLRVLLRQRVLADSHLPRDFACAEFARRLDHHHAALRQLGSCEKQVPKCHSTSLSWSPEVRPPPWHRGSGKPCHLIVAQQLEAFDGELALESCGRAVPTLVHPRYDESGHHRLQKCVSAHDERCWFRGTICHEDQGRCFTTSCLLPVPWTSKKGCDEQYPPSSIKELLMFARRRFDCLARSAMKTNIVAPQSVSVSMWIEGSIMASSRYFRLQREKKRIWSHHRPQNVDRLALSLPNVHTSACGDEGL